MLRMIAISSGLVALSIGAGIGLSASHALVGTPQRAAALSLRVAELEQPAVLPGRTVTEREFAPVTRAAFDTAPAVVAPAPLPAAAPDALELVGWEDDEAYAPLTSPRPLKRPDFATTTSSVTTTAIPRFAPVFEPIYTAPIVSVPPRVIYGAPAAEVARRPTVLPGYLIGVYR